MLDRITAVQLAAVHIGEQQAQLRAAQESRRPSSCCTGEQRAQLRAAQDSSRPAAVHAYRRAAGPATCCTGK